MASQRTPFGLVVLFLPVLLQHSGFAHAWSEPDPPPVRKPVRRHAGHSIALEGTTSPLRFSLSGDVTLFQLSRFEWIDKTIVPKYSLEEKYDETFASWFFEFACVLFDRVV